MSTTDEREPVLVTGASGFVGRHLCTRLADLGFSVRALLRRTVDGPWDDAWHCDLGRDPVPPAALAGVHGVYHLAGRAHAVDDALTDEAPYQRTNVDGTRALAEALPGGSSRLVIVSSVKAMGEGGHEPQDADAECRPTSVYGRTKLAAEEAAMAVANRTGLDVRILRPCLIHGPGQRGNLERMFRAVARGRFPPLDISTNRRSMVHVEDVVDALVALGRTDDLDGRRYVVSGPGPISTRQLHEAMLRALGRPMPTLWWPPALLAPLAVAGDVAGRLLGRRMPFDRAAFARLTGSASYGEAVLTADTGFASRRSLDDTLDALGRTWREAGGT